MPPSNELQPAPPGRRSGLMPPLAGGVAPGITRPARMFAPDVPPSSVPPWVMPTLAAVGLIGKAVATGVPRVSIDRPRLDWLPFPKSRSRPYSTPFQLFDTEPMMLKPSLSRSLQPAVADKR